MMSVIKKSAIFLVIIFCVSSLFAGCGAGESIVKSKSMLDDYYEKFSIQDIAGMTALFHEDLIKELGNEESLQTRLMSRRALLGDVEKYELTGTSFEINNNITKVTVNVKTQYSLEETLEEEFSFTMMGDDISITGIRLPKETVMDTIAQDFIHSLGDAQAMTDLFIPALRSAQLTAQMENAMQQLISTAGEYQSNTFVGNHYYYRPIDGYDANFVCLSVYNLHFSKMDMDFEFQFAEQDGVIGLFNVPFSPSSTNID